jgi:antitoxin component of MazEF toxin-antitoxin module
MEKNMIKKLTAHGNSAALIIDKPILELLKITMDTPLEISTDGKQLIIAPIGEGNREEDIKNAIEKINQRRRKSIRE